MSPIDLGMIFPERRQIKNDSESEGKMPQKIQFNGPHKWFFFLNEKLCCSGFYHKKNHFYKKAGFCFQLFSQWMEEPKGIPSNWFCNVRNPQGGVRGLVVWSPNSYSHPVGHTIQCWNEQLNWWCSRLPFKGTSKRENKE